jgi:hypothetical protein
MRPYWTLLVVRPAFSFHYYKHIQTNADNPCQLTLIDAPTRNFQNYDISPTWYASRWPTSTCMASEPRIEESRPLTSETHWNDTAFDA